MNFQFILKKLIFLPLVLILILVMGLAYFYINVQPVSGNKSFSYFVINKGASVSQIGNKLESAGLVKSALAFKIYITFTGQTTKLTPGEFRLTPSFNLFQVAQTLFKGPVELWVTIPEGLRREEIAAKFATGLDRDQNFVDEFLQNSKGKEGYLFPDTYLFPMDASASAVVKKMTDTFTIKTADLKTENSNLSFSQAVILASIIERETKTEEERPVVAGILINRLDAGMPLQVDASVQYAVAIENCKLKIVNCSWWPILTLENLKIASPYNTYKYVGLPPAPICNPGLSSLHAAMNPTQSDFWYYIHDKEGQIHYARTLEEQNTNIAKYLGK
jgi:UPF0755 protein